VSSASRIILSYRNRGRGSTRARNASRMLSASPASEARRIEEVSAVAVE
jgi:hypothetical protein